MIVPPVTIGLPVYNGEQFVARAIESVLAQVFTDFQLIISDNASTDSTYEICRSFADKDSRIRLRRNEINRGARINFNLLFEMAESPYFMWVAADDVLDANYVAYCYEFLEANPEYVVCCSNVTLIDAAGRELMSRIFDFELDTDDAARRFAKCLRNWTLPIPIYGLLRTGPIKEAGVQLTDMFGTDQIFVLELSMVGKFHQLRTPLMYRRLGERWKFLPENAPGYPMVENQYRYYADNYRAIFDSKIGGHWFPMIETYWALCRAVLGRSPDFRTKSQLLFAMSLQFSPIEATYWDLMMLLYRIEVLRPSLGKIHYAFRKVRPVIRKFQNLTCCANSRSGSTKPS